MLERYRIKDDMIKSVGEFSILWCQFEQCFFDADATTNKLQKWAESKDCDKELIAQCEKVKDATIEYMPEISKKAIQERIFSEKNHGTLEQRNIIYDFLTKETTLIGCILYIYRIRNNFFHGLKDIYRLNDQNEMFVQINTLLNRILKKEGC